MNKVFIQLIVLFLIFISITSCEKEITPEVDISTSSITISPEGDAEILTLTSNVSWSAAVTGGSFSISPSSGNAGTIDISISASQNSGTSAISDNLVITAGSLTKSISITQETSTFKASTSLLQFPYEESSLQLTITSNVAWRFYTSSLPSWVKSISPQEGEGDCEVTITTYETTERSRQEFILDISYLSTWYSVLVYKEAVPNTAPTKATNLAPNSTDVSTIATFSWDASEDIDGDTIEYTAMYSTDGEEWTSVAAGEACSVSVTSINKVLEPSTKYYYKVKSDDGYSGGTTESDVVEFTTSDTADAYADGDYAVYQQSTMPNSVKLVFTGDGYLAEHFEYGGLFDQNINEGIEALFSMEPYKTYRDYFTVYKVAAYSKETGISSSVDGTSKNTAFSSTLTGGTGVECDYSKVFTYTTKVDGIETSDLVNMSTCLVINADVYAGTCISYADGKSIGMCPVSRGSTDMTSFGNLVCHEFGGHGFGKLADEYYNYEESLPESEKETLLAWQNYGYSLNVSPYSSASEVPWSRFMGLTDYSEVGAYQGGYYYAYGVYRPEYVSCMIDNRKYFNAQSRYLIVKRIFDVIGEEFDFDAFVANDVDKYVDTKSTGTYTVSNNFVPLAPPILIMED